MVKVEDLKGKVVIITGGGGAIGGAMAKQFAANGAKVVVACEDFAPAAIEALRSIADRIAPALQISEVRTMAADELWLSPAYDAD